jgi:hypothetical protein
MQITVQRRLPEPCNCLTGTAIQFWAEHVYVELSNAKGTFGFGR